MKRAVLDSYAILAYFEDEPGAEAVQRLLEEAEAAETELLLSVVNWGEIYYSLYRTKGGGKAEESLVVMEQLPVKLVDVNKELMYHAAQLKADHAVALGDCFAAALGAVYKCPVVTGDREFGKFGAKVTVQWL